MHEFWLKYKLILLIGLFQFGLILILIAIANLIKLILSKQNNEQNSKQNSNYPNSPNQIEQELNFTAIALSDVSKVEDNEVANQVPNALNDVTSNPINHEIILTSALVNQSDRLDPLEQDQIQDQIQVTALGYKVNIAPELLTQLKAISGNPTAIIDEAIRWWLRRRHLDVLDASDDLPDRMGMRSNRSRQSAKDFWND